jgi:hypothetical protein
MLSLKGRSFRTVLGRIISVKGGMRQLMGVLGEERKRELEAGRMEVAFGSGISLFSMGT